MPTVFRFAGILLATGSLVFVVGIALYATLPSDLGTPSAETSYAEALREATTLPTQMERAGRVIYLGDLLIAAAALALLPRKRLVSSDVERVGWSLIFVSFVPAFVFDSLFGSALPRLAVGAPETFPAFKSWFDLQFAVGNIPFGIGAIAVFIADARSDQPTLLAVVDYLAALVCGLALLGGLAYVLGLFVSATLTGGTLGVAALAFGALGAQIARKG
ncbi:MAG: hypothetical protein E6I75_15055 [Chloroflexi bacterium]|nr:MAG: hypothetical protein E6I75_15055 [Chloroflexota bacterium]